MIGPEGEPPVLHASLSVKMLTHSLQGRASISKVDPFPAPAFSHPLPALRCRYREAMQGLGLRSSRQKGAVAGLEDESPADGLLLTV